MAGPLAGVRVVELLGIGPGPFGGMMLADMGADVVTVGRNTPGIFGAADTSKPATNPMERSKRSVVLDFKNADDLATLKTMVANTDVVIDPFRPGVCERLGIGPAELCALNPRLIFARMTGWGQIGPWALRAGHDINYIALSGALHSFGFEGQPPTFPINVLGDFAGGGQLLAMGVCAALVERATSGLGQVIDVAMVDGASQLLGPFFAPYALGTYGDRGTNMLDGGAHFYNVYETLDGRYLSVGGLEPQFYAELMQGLGIDPPMPQWDQSQWPSLKVEVAKIVASKTRYEWCEIFANSDACVAPVLAPAEVAADPHNADRQMIATVNGVPQPQPAPRFSRTPTTAGVPEHRGATAAADVLSDWAKSD